MNLKIKKFSKYIVDWISVPSRLRGHPTLPVSINFPITDTCNSRCVMCDVWKEKGENELTAKEIREVFSEPLFKKVKHIGISGGEPTLRKDLVECVEAMLEALPNLVSLSITSHGFQHAKWERMLKPISDACVSSGVHFRLNLSLDGIGKIHDIVRGIPGGFGRVMKTREIARREGVEVQFQCTVSDTNLYDAPELIHFLAKNGEDFIIRKAVDIARLDNVDSMKTAVIKANDDSYFADLLLSKKLLKATSNPARRLFYKDLGRRLLKGGDRKAPCYYQKEAVLIDAQANMFHCSIVDQKIGNIRNGGGLELYESEECAKSREVMMKSICTSCMHDQSGAWHPVSLVIEVLSHSVKPLNFDRWKQLVELLKYKACSMLYSMQTPREVLEIGKRKRAIIIGAYGGEHLGDAALLGGVITRTIQNFGIKEFVILSTRVSRTEAWTSKLQIPEVTLEVHNIGNYRSIVGKSGDVVVYGGGPIMDMPVDHTRHLAVALYARKQCLPFIIEGVGYGPFKTSYSANLGKMLIKCADRVTMRSDYGVEKAKILQDPAFDYLERVITQDSPITDFNEATYLQNLNESIGGGSVCGLNFRPIWHKYLNDDDEVGGHESHVVDVLCKVLIENSTTKFLFLSYNCDQYGMSDLDEYFALKDALAENYGDAGKDALERLFVMNRELSPEGMIKAIRFCDTMVAMRFHACIFSLAAGVKTLGVEYNTRGGGKVERLFKDRGKHTDVVNVSKLTATVITDFIA